MGGPSWGYKGGLLGAVPLRRKAPGVLFFLCALVLAGFCWFCRCGCFCLWLRPALCALALVVGRYGVVGLDFGVFAQFLLSRNTLCDVICYPL